MTDIYNHTILNLYVKCQTVHQQNHLSLFTRICSTYEVEENNQFNICILEINRIKDNFIQTVVNVALILSQNCYCYRVLNLNFSTLSSTL